MTTYKRPSFPTLFTGDIKLFRPFDKNIVTVLDDQADNLQSILDSGISFSDNVDCVYVTYTSNATPDTQDSVTHTLGKVPTGFIIADIDKAGVIYRSAASTKTNLFLKCNVASSTVTLIVF